MTFGRTDCGDIRCGSKLYRLAPAQLIDQRQLGSRMYLKAFVER